MSDVAIKVEGLGKRYHIGGPQARYKTLRDSITNAMAAPFRRAAKLLQGHAYGAAELDETIWALKDVSFEVKKGEVLGIIGRNGAGKSTLLKILSRITEPTEGSAEIYGRVGSLLEVGTGFHPELTGRDNIYLNGAILGMKKNEIEKKFDEIVAFSEIEKFIDTPVKHYSSGMYMRLAFAVAAHLEPEILVVDEVLAVGDAQFQKKCLGKMGEVAKQGRTVLFVSHNMGAIRALCSHGLLLDSGLLIADGPINEVVDKYVSMSMIRVNSSWSIADDPEIPLQVTSIKVVDSNGQICRYCDVKDPIELVITHRCRKTLVGSVVLLCIFHNGIELIHSFDTDAFPQRLISRKSGDYIDRIRLPAGLLKPGSLAISIRTAVVNKNMAFQDHPDVIRLDLNDFGEDTSFKGYAANRSGLLRISPHWEAVDLVSN